MKAHIIEQVHSFQTTVGQIGCLREWIQAYALKSLSEMPHFGGLSFVGGTALRFIYGTERFSEDLDFSAENLTFLDMQAWADKTEEALKMAGLKSRFEWKASCTTLP